MPSIDAIKEVTLQVYDAAADPDLWPDVLERVRGELNGAGSALIDYDFATHACRVVASAGAAVDLVHCRQEGQARQIPWIRDGPWHASGRAGQGHEIIADEALANCPADLRWLKPNGVFHRLCGVVRRNEDRVLLIVASRPASSGRYDERETGFLAELLPHLRHAVQLSRKLQISQATASAFEHLPYAVLIVDAAGRPVLMNAAAEASLAGSDVRLDRQGRLAAFDAAATDRLHRAIADAASGDRDAFRPFQSVLAGRAGRHAARLLTVAPADPRAREAPPGQAAVLVLDPPRPVEWRQRELRQAYGLTPAEARLALLILQGLRLDEAQGVLGIRYSTARTHMRRIYAKTGTRRQGELIRLLMSAQWPFGPGNADDEEER